MQKQLIIDTMPFEVSVTEAKEGQGLRLRGVCQRAGVRNGNGRIYEEKILRREVTKLSKAVERRRVTGELDHPAYSDIRLGKAGHVITAIEMKDNGEVVCELEILEESPYGKQTAALARAGVEFGISSRGRGTTTRRDGAEFIGEDFELDTFDLVSNPSTKDAWMAVVHESKETETGEGRTHMETSQVKNLYRELREQAEQLLAQNPATMSESSRSNLSNQVEVVVEGLDRLVLEDRGLTSNVAALVDRLHKRTEFLRSAAAPPPVEHQTNAAGQIIEEMVHQFGQREAALVLEAKRRVQAAHQRARKAEAQANTLARQIRRLQVEHTVAMEAGEQLYRKVKTAGVKEHVNAILARPRNAFLRPVAQTLRECKTTKEVNRKVEQFTRAFKRSRRVVEEIRSSSRSHRSALREDEVERRSGVRENEESTRRNRGNHGESATILENMRSRTSLRT